MVTLCFDGPRSESLSPSCAPVRHSKFQNSSSPITPLRPCLNSDHLCSSPGDLILPCTVSISPWQILPSSLPHNFRKDFLNLSRISIHFLSKVSYPKQLLWRRKAFSFTAVFTVFIVFLQSPLQSLTQSQLSQTPACTSRPRHRGVSFFYCWM